LANPLLQIETRPGQAMMAGGKKITPFSQSVRLVLPGRQAGFIYNRPVSILATYPDGQEEVIPVKDVTRQVQLALLGIALAWTALLMFLSIIMKRRDTNG
jgi:hypothetical protein